MTLDEYKAEVDKINRESDKKKNDLIIRYCHENARFKAGDIVEDHNGKVLVEKVVASRMFSGIPDPVYRGKSLKKDGTPRKDVEIRNVYQSDIKP